MSKLDRPKWGSNGLWPKFSGLRLPAFRPVGNKNLTGGNPRLAPDEGRFPSASGYGLIAKELSDAFNA